MQVELLEMLDQNRVALTIALRRASAAGLAGVLARYGITRLTLHTEALIWSTVGINIVGSFLLGLLAAEHWFSRDVREAIGVGFLGGFTTSPPSACRSCWRPRAGAPGRPRGTSSSVVEDDTRPRARRPGEAAGYLAASVVGGIAAAALGYWLGRRLASVASSSATSPSTRRAISSRVARTSSIGRPFGSARSQSR